MRKYRIIPILLALCVLPGGTLVGCRRGPAQLPPAPPPVVPVSQPVARDVTDFVDYTGRTDAVESVGIKARVTGYLDRMPFKEGTEVRKGALLFEIDPRPYQAQLAQAAGQVDLYRAQLRLAQATYAMDQAAAAQTRGSVSQHQLDVDLAGVAQAEAGVKAAQASMQVYALNVEFTQVTCPIDGMVSRYYYTLGNLVIQDQTLLTTVVSVNPMYAYFDMDEPTLLRIRRALNEGKIKAPRESSEVPIFLGLQGEDGFPHEGSFNFINNVINPSTGTIAVRGVFSNYRPNEGLAECELLVEGMAGQGCAPLGAPLGAALQHLTALSVMDSRVLTLNTRRLLAPGMFVRIRLPIGQAHPALLVIDRAVGSDQGLPFVYVVNAQNKVEYRRITTGPLQDDGLRVIESGLNPDDWVVTGAVQQVRPRLDVSPDRVPMPTLTGPATATNKPQPPPPGENQPGQK